MYSSSIAGLRPFAAIRKVHHPFCHVLAVQLRLVESHIRLQHTVGDHVVQAGVGTLYHHRRQTGSGAGRPLNHIPHQIFKAVGQSVKMITHRGL
ncbi:hypothetical protein, partial [Escherichia coli]